MKKEMNMKKKAKFLRALGNETRLTIVQMAMTGEVCACMFVPYTGKSQPTVSRHLRILEEAGVLTSKRDGQNILYTISDRRAADILNLLGLKPIEIKEKC